MLSLKDVLVLRGIIHRMPPWAIVCSGAPFRTCSKQKRPVSHTGPAAAVELLHFRMTLRRNFAFHVGQKRESRGKRDLPESGTGKRFLLQRTRD
jgi:hypothetical protein